MDDSWQDIVDQAYQTVEDLSSRANLEDYEESVLRCAVIIIEMDIE